MLRKCCIATTLTLLFLACFALPSTTRAQGTCSADVESRLDNEDQEESFTRLQFAVDVRSSDTCARIEYDLVVEVLLSNGQTKKVRKPQVVKLSDGSLTTMVRHELPAGERLLSHEAKVVRCDRCALDP